MSVIWGHTAIGCIHPFCSEREWEQIIVACAFRCFYCCRLLKQEDYTKDHLYPIFRGGCKCRGNLVLSCPRCNSMKKKQTVYEFLKVRPSYVDITGTFFTSINALEPLVRAQDDPLMKETVRIAKKMRFPDAPSYAVPQVYPDLKAESPYWRSR